MNFDQWMQRPVYIVGVYTYRLARSLPEFTEEGGFHFRSIPSYRRRYNIGAKARRLRLATANALRGLRASGLNRKAVRREAIAISVAKGGHAIAVRNLDRQLSLATN